MAKLNYVDLPSANLAQSKAFYAKVFGWSLVDYGPFYSCTTDQDTNIGLNGALDQILSAPLPVILVEDLEETLSAVQAAGASITVPIFSFPGGRRFHFRDPSGNEMAAWVETA